MSRGGAGGAGSAIPAADLPGPALDASAAHLRLGTRGSALALAQSETVAAALRELGATVELIVIRTAGDARPPDMTWGEGAFVTALEAALLGGRIDVAVHSAKDVPTLEDPRLVIAAYPPREDPRDALVSRDGATTLAGLRPGARVGTASPRRVAFLLAARPDLRPHPLHGNVDTRLRRLAAGETDALVLAVAGLARLGLAGRISERISPKVLPPAPGQGALAVQVRADDAAALAIVRRLDDAATRIAVEAERAFLAASGGGCRAPLGALATVDGTALDLLGGAADPESVPAGSAPAERAAEVAGATFTAPTNTSAPRPVRVAWGRRHGALEDGAELAEALAADLAETVGRARRPAVLVTREAAQAAGLMTALRERGLEAVLAPTIATAAEPAGGALDAAVDDLAAYEWVVVTSGNGARALAAAAARRGGDLAAARVAAVGAATADVVASAGGRASFVPEVATAMALAAALPVTRGDSVLVVGGDRGDGQAAARLRARGAVVDEVIAYRTVEGPESARGPVGAALARPLAAITFTSGSTVRGLLRLAADTERPGLLALPACCIGPSTAAAARAAGFADVREAATQDVGALADLAAAAAQERPGRSALPRRPESPGTDSAVPALAVAGSASKELP